MLEPVAASQAATQPMPAVVPVIPAHSLSFRDVLSALNPLQYLPVVGTIYRAVTGDQIPEALRRIGSVIASGLIGGPIGAAVNVAVQVMEKATGIDLDQTGQRFVTAATHAGEATASVRPAVAAAVAMSDGASVPPAKPWSPAQLAAYGVTTSADGTLRLGGLSGAEVLNSLELSQVQLAQSAYGHAMAL
jgi:hypothetical protein